MYNVISLIFHKPVSVNKYHNFNSIVQLTLGQKNILIFCCYLDILILSKMIYKDTG